MGKRGRPPKNKALPVTSSSPSFDVTYDILPDILPKENNYLEAQKNIYLEAENPYNLLNDASDGSLQTMLQDSFMELVEKNHLPIEYKDFNEVISHVSNYSDADSEFNKLYVSKMINAITDVAKVKSMITLGQLTNKALSVFQKVADDPSLDSLDVMVSSIREVYDWMNKLEDLQKKYYIVGTDKQLSMMSEQANRTSDDTRLTPAAIKDIIKQINKSTYGDKNNGQKK